MQSLVLPSVSPLNGRLQRVVGSVQTGVEASAPRGGRNLLREKRGGLGEVAAQADLVRVGRAGTTCLSAGACSVVQEVSTRSLEQPSPCRALESSSRTDPGVVADKDPASLVLAGCWQRGVILNQDAGHIEHIPHSELITSAAHGLRSCVPGDRHG